MQKNSIKCSPLNVSKPVCSSNATKRNVCNASSASRLINPLNFSKRVFSSNKTKRNVCNAISVSQLVKPWNVSKMFVMSSQLGLQIFQRN